MLLVAVLGLAGAPARAETDDDRVRAQILEILTERHPTDTPAWWQKLGANAPGIIIQLYGQTPSVPSRARLLTGLSAFNTVEAIEFFKNLATTTDEPVLRQTAIRGVGRTAGAREEEWLEKQLRHEDPQTRVAAADALRMVGTARSRAALEAQRKEEKLPWLQSRMAESQLPMPSGKLVSSGSSEDRVDPLWAGHWTGTWLRPRAGTQKGMISADVRARFWIDANRLQGQLEAGPIASPRRYDLQSAVGTGVSIPLVWKRASETWNGGFQISRDTETVILQGKSSLGGILVFKKDP